MKCTNCKTEVESEATDRGICYDCYCQLDLQDYETHLQLNSMDDSGAVLVGDDAVVPLQEEE